MSNSNAFTGPETAGIFSSDRLDRLKDIYKLDDKGTLLLHAQLGQLNGAIYASISLFEVHFRNMILCCLDDVYGDTWLYTTPITDFANLHWAVKTAERSAKRNSYSKLPYKDRKAKKVQFAGQPEDQKKKNAIETMIVSRSDIVPHLYFSFWKSLFSKSLEPQMWNKGLRKIFPDKNIKRGQVSDYLERCHKTRNRISHNEFIHPVFCHKYIEAMTFLTKELSYKDQISQNRIYQFHAPYIDKIKLQLLELEHFLMICK